MLNVSPLRSGRRPRCGVGQSAGHSVMVQPITDRGGGGLMRHTVHRLCVNHESGVATDDWMCQDRMCVIRRGVWTDVGKCVDAHPRLNSLLVTGERCLGEI